MTSVTEDDELSFKSRGVESESHSRILSSTSYLFTSPARAWSYDNVLTYPCMVLPVRMETRLEKRVVNGVEREVEVEVEVELPLKRLFLFPGKEVR